VDRKHGSANRLVPLLTVYIERPLSEIEANASFDTVL